MVGNITLLDSMLTKIGLKWRYLNRGKTFLFVNCDIFAYALWRFSLCTVTFLLRQQKPPWAFQPAVWGISCLVLLPSPCNDVDFCAGLKMCNTRNKFPYAINCDCFYLGNVTYLFMHCDIFAYALWRCSSCIVTEKKLRQC